MYATAALWKARSRVRGSPASVRNRALSEAASTASSTRGRGANGISTLVIREKATTTGRLRAGSTTKPANAPCSRIMTGRGRLNEFSSDAWLSAPTPARSSRRSWPRRFDSEALRSTSTRRSGREDTVRRRGDEARRGGGGSAGWNGGRRRWRGSASEARVRATCVFRSRARFAATSQRDANARRSRCGPTSSSSATTTSPGRTAAAAASPRARRRSTRSTSPSRRRVSPHASVAVAGASSRSRANSASRSSTLERRDDLPWDRRRSVSSSARSASSATRGAGSFTV
mmetsp:Transcript_23629/g.61701  ORF Transcript_23629/g.61701 Transcript_23629/m.61701 type:complete len:287 (-) Transcript_23629:145-1005(-)